MMIFFLMATLASAVKMHLILSCPVGKWVVAKDIENLWKTYKG